MHLPIRSCLGDRQSALRTIPLVCACGLLAAFSCKAREAVIPAGTALEVRLSTPVGSRLSRPGDRVAGTIIAPVLAEGRQLLLSGASISGSVDHVQRLGLGLKHEIARLAFRFDSITLPDGRHFPILGRIREVENAREHVDKSGDVDGILPLANASSGISFVIWTMLVHTELTAPAAIVKAVIARSPDSEIYLPIGTELVVDLDHALSIDLGPPVPERVPPLAEGDRQRVQQFLATLPVQQAMVGRKRSSDLVNLLLLGSSSQVDAAFRGADWTGQNRRGALALFRMYHSLVQRMGYTNLPMAQLTLNGVRATRSYQKSLDTIAKRHHVRLWNQSDPSLWLGAATEDVGFALRHMHVTHAIDLAIDNERAKVVNDLWFAGCIESASLVARPSLRVRNDAGSPLVTDREIAVLRLKNCDSAPIPKPHTPRWTRAAEAFEAVAMDTARANPFTIGLLAFRSFASHDRSSPAERASEAKMQAWDRPSVIKQPALVIVQQPLPRTPEHKRTLPIATVSNSCPAWTDKNGQSESGIVPENLLRSE